MTSLNNFKMDGRNVDEPVIGGAPNLDMMLGDLQEDMDKQVSVSVTAAPLLKPFYKLCSGD